jgi:hypothetical protein
VIKRWKAQFVAFGETITKVVNEFTNGVMSTVDVNGLVNLLT